MITKMTYESHIRKGREAVKGTTGWDRLIAISFHFDNMGHPHSDITLQDSLSNRVIEPCSDHKFAAKVMSEMAYLIAVNKELVA